MIPWVYALSSQGLTPPMHLDAHQFQEILLTAAQSFFAIALLMNLHLHKRQAIWLLLLFLGQFLSPLYEEPVAALLGLNPDPLRFHAIFSWAYLIFGLCTVVRDRKYLLLLLRGFRI